jgi:hypothetical protein
MLRAARESVERLRTTLPASTVNAALESLYVAEGSDWFWWYGDEHISANQADFDFLFRWYVQQAYHICGIEPPADTYLPIIKSGKSHLIIPQRGAVHPTIDGQVSSEQEWENAGFYDAVMAGGAMHQAADIFKRLYYGQDDKMLYFRCDLHRPLHDNEQVEFYFIAPKQVSIKQSPTSLTIQTYIASGVPTTFPNCSFAYHQVFELSVPRSFVFSEADRRADGTYELKLRIHITSHTGTTMYPSQGSLELEFGG